MITLHFHLQPQYKYELFYIYFTSLHCTGKYELNKLTSLPMHRTGIAEVTGSNPVEALIFFRLLLSNCLNWKIYCDDHSSLSKTDFLNLTITSTDVNCALYSHVPKDRSVDLELLVNAFNRQIQETTIFSTKI